MESLGETRYFPKSAFARGHSRLLRRTCRHGLHVSPSSGTHGCHRRCAEHGRSQKDICNGWTTTHEALAHRSVRQGLLANPSSSNHSGRVGLLRGPPQAHSGSTTMDAVGKDHYGARRAIGPSGVGHGIACPSGALGKRKWFPQDIPTDRPPYVLGFRITSEQNQGLCATLGETANNGVTENVHAGHDTSSTYVDFPPNTTLLCHNGTPVGGGQTGAHWIRQASRHRGEAMDVGRVPWTWTGGAHPVAESAKYEKLKQHPGDPPFPVLVCRRTDKGRRRRVGSQNMGNRRTKRAATSWYCKSAWGRAPLQKDTHSRVRIPSWFRLWNHMGSRRGCTCLSLGQGPSSFLPTPCQHARNQTGLRHYLHRSANRLAIAQAGVHRHRGNSSDLEAVRVTQNPTSYRRSWPLGEATLGHTGRRRPRDCLSTGCRGGQPRHGTRSVKLPPPPPG